MVQPSLGFVILFLLFSLLFLSNSYKLWFKTDEYYQSIYTQGGQKLRFFKGGKAQFLTVGII
jgi:hypothetical protein